MGPEVIDLKGISYAVSAGIFKAFQKLELDPTLTQVKLDGLLKGPPEFLMQETIIKGDSKEKVIGLASILAKVTRDAYMIKIASNFPEYNFHIHKGYGTKKHREAILAFGPCAVHRQTFLRRLVG
jgi:ribonuclease HII